MDPISLAATALGAGLSAGLALIGVTVAAMSALRPAGGTVESAPASAAYLLTIGTLGGLLLAGSVTWRLLAPVASTYRRGGLALVAAFATVPLMLIYPALDATLGVPALVGAAILTAVIALLLFRHARRLAAA